MKNIGLSRRPLEEGRTCGMGQQRAIAYTNTTNMLMVETLAIQRFF